MNDKTQDRPNDWNLAEEKATPASLSTRGRRKFSKPASDYVDAGLTAGTGCVSLPRTPRSSSGLAIAIEL